MSGKGFWTVQLRYKNCGKCPACRNDADEKPHGPYALLRRRNPDDAGRGGKQDELYLGTFIPDDEQLVKINELYSGPDVPTRKEVRRALGDGFSYE